MPEQRFVFVLGCTSSNPCVLRECSCRTGITVTGKDTSQRVRVVLYRLNREKYPIHIILNFLYFYGNFFGNRCSKMLLDKGGKSYIQHCIWYCYIKCSTENFLF